MTAPMFVGIPGRGIGGHHSANAGKDEWLTPPSILAALGPFDLDPCSPVVRPWPTAATHYTELDDGLTLPWIGRVWMNPPYGPATGHWLERLVEHGDGIALVFARTETEAWVDYVWSKADAVFFLFGRLNFHHVNGERAIANSGAPSALIAYGRRNAEVLRNCGLAGAFVAFDRAAPAKQWPGFAGLGSPGVDIDAIHRPKENTHG